MRRPGTSALPPISEGANVNNGMFNKDHHLRTNIVVIGFVRTL